MVIWVRGGKPSQRNYTVPPTASHFSCEVDKLLRSLVHGRWKRCLFCYKRNVETAPKDLLIHNITVSLWFWKTYQTKLWEMQTNKVILPCSWLQEEVPKLTCLPRRLSHLPPERSFPNELIQTSLMPRGRGWDKGAGRKIRSEEWPHAAGCGFLKAPWLPGCGMHSGAVGLRFPEEVRLLPMSSGKLLV